MNRPKLTASSRTAEKRLVAPGGSAAVGRLSSGASRENGSDKPAKGTPKKESGKKGAVKPLESGELKSKEDVRNFVLNIRDRMADDGLAAIHALSALNCILASADVYKLMDSESKEIARDIYLRIKQAGIQVRNPSILFQE